MMDKIPNKSRRGQKPGRGNVNYVVFCPEKVAIVGVSGIITTTLGKTATSTKVAGREKADTSLQNMPFSRTGEGHFFLLLVL
jgi:hypothetical protein